MDDISQYLDLFKEEATEILQTFNDALLALEEDPHDKQVIEELFRAAHSLKGMAATMEFDEIAEFTHKIENVLDKVREEKVQVSTPLMDLLFKCSDILQTLLEEVGAENKETGIDLSNLITNLEKASNGEFAVSENIEKKKPISQSADPPTATKETVKKLSTMHTVRVKLEHLDNLMNLVGELVISKARLDQLEESRKVPELGETMDRVRAILGDLQHEVMQVRMVPVGQVFNRFPRMVRDIAHELGKEVEFLLEGSEIELDRTILDEIGDPLVHLLRNAVGHGVETPEEREQKGKPKLGRIQLIARREKDGAVVEVSDDGKGINTEKIRKIACRNGFISEKEAETLDDNEVMQLISLPGFTSAGETTSLSGRGVGVDAVKAKVESLGGTLSVKSELGKGTQFIMKLPPSLAIIKALLVKVGGETYAIPLKDIAEVVEVKRDALKRVKDENVIIIHDQVVPLIYLRECFGISSNGENRKETCAVVVVEIDGRRKGLIVDAILSQQDIVIKPLGEILQSTRGLGGATILGSGTVAFILDPRNLSVVSRTRRIDENEKTD